MKILFIVLGLVNCAAGLYCLATGVPDHQFLTHGLLFAILANVWSWK